MADQKQTIQDKKQPTTSGGSIKTKTLRGVVVSDKMKDTVVVEVSRYSKHSKYGKYINARKKYKAHNEGNTKAIGDKVEIEKVRPISKDKHFKVVS